MLILGRRRGERILLGENISLRVLKIEKNFVSLGFDAPKGINIRRSEVAARLSGTGQIRSSFTGII